MTASTDAAEIRRIAAAAAEGFSQAEDGKVSDGVDEKKSKAVVSEEKGCMGMEGNDCSRFIWMRRNCLACQGCLKTWLHSLCFLHHNA